MKEQSKNLEKNSQSLKIELDENAKLGVGDIVFLANVVKDIDDHFTEIGESPDPEMGRFVSELREKLESIVKVSKLKVEENESFD